MESAAINAYSRDEYYGDINKQFRLLPLDKVDLSDPEALKRAGVTNSDLAMLISALVTGMKKLPPAQADDSIFEALGRNVILPQEELALYQEGNIVPMKTFISTTVSQQEMVTEHWWDNKDLALFIYQSVGGNGRDISLFSHFAKEKEILFLPNTKFEVMFRGAPSLTEPGLHPDGTPKPNPKEPKVTKTLITLVEVPADKPAAAKPEKKNPPQTGRLISVCVNSE